MTTKFPTEKKSLQNVNEKAYIQRLLLAKKLVFFFSKVMANSI